MKKVAPNGTPSRAHARGPTEARKERAAMMIAAGRKQREIGRELGVSKRTVKRYRADPKVQEVVEERRQAMLHRAHLVGAEIIGTLAFQMRGSLLDVLTPTGKFSVAHARKTGYDGLLKSVSIREEKTKRGKRATITRVEVHSSQAAAVELSRILCLDKQYPKSPHDAEHLQVELDERIAFAIEGFGRGGVLLTRRDILEMFNKNPQTAGELLPLIQAELAGSEEIQ